MFLSKLFSMFKSKKKDKPTEGPVLSSEAKTSIPAAGTAVVGGAVGISQEPNSQPTETINTSETPISMPEPGSSVAMSTPENSPVSAPEDSASHQEPLVQSAPTEIPSEPVVEPAAPEPVTPPVVEEEPVVPPSEPVSPPTEIPSEPVQAPEDPTQNSLV